MAIRKNLGKFICFGPNHCSNSYRIVPKTCIDMDLRKGLTYILEIVYERSKIIQIVDYQNVSF